MSKWEDQEITEQLEVHIGKDLQYIRVNGALAGGIIGVLIYFINLIFN